MAKLALSEETAELLKSVQVKPVKTLAPASVPVETLKAQSEPPSLIPPFRHATQIRPVSLSTNQPWIFVLRRACKPKKLDSAQPISQINMK